MTDNTGVGILKIQEKLIRLRKSKGMSQEDIFIPEGVEPLSRDIVEQPELRVYTDGFGTKPGDNCLVATHEGKIVGALWTRIMNENDEEFIMVSEL